MSACTRPSTGSCQPTKRSAVNPRRRSDRTWQAPPARPWNRARLGGDEFVVLCEHTTADDATVIAEPLRVAVAEPFILGTHAVRLTASVGVSTAHADTHGPEQAASAARALLHADDRYMYDFKQAGRRSAS